jgi:tRNA-dihydrouridine synthase
MNIWDNLTKPCFILAPMDEVTDTVFRQIVASCAAPDLFFTEFINVDAMQSKGRDRTLSRLRLDSDKEHPIIAQIWGLTPDNFYKSAKDIAEMGYDGIDLNFGCPAKNETRAGTCSAFILPANRPRALEIIQATQEGAKAGANTLPVSAKTRLGYDEIDLTWHELLLKQDLAALIIHGRTKKQMSKAQANWDKIGEIRQLRDKLSPETKIIGNGDVITRAQGEALAQKHELDGVMIGRGIFKDPYVFANKSPWESLSPEERISIFRRHVRLFAETWQHNERNVAVLNKFCKVYVNDFDGAKDMREKIMSVHSTDEILKILDCKLPINN